MIDLAHSLVGSLDTHQLISSFDFSNFDLTWFDIDWNVFAQDGKPQQFDQDVTKDMSKGWNNFIKSGQVWALIIGLTLGYLFRSVTSS